MGFFNNKHLGEKLFSTADKNVDDLFTKQEFDFYENGISFIVSHRILFGPITMTYSEFKYFRIPKESLPDKKRIDVKTKSILISKLRFERLTEEEFDKIKNLLIEKGIPEATYNN